MQDSFFLAERPRSECAVWGRKSVLSVEFDPDVTRGLCARGNYCQELAVHKDRAFRAKAGEEFPPDAQTANSLLHSLEALSPDSVAILLDGSLTLEETAKAIALAERLGTKFVAPLPSEDMAVAPFKNNISFEKIANATTNLVIGDIFTMSPTITKLIHDASNIGRNNTMVSVDTVRARTGWFAHPELVVPVGRVPLLLDAITAAVGGKPIDELPLAELGISADDFGWAVSAVKSVEGNGNVIFAPGWHFADPFAVAGAAQRLAEIAGFGFAVLPIATNSRGIYRLLAGADCDIAGTYKAIADGKIDGVLALDCDPLEALPGMKIPDVFGMTGQLMTTGYHKATHFIPSKFLFEKTGKILGTEENIIELAEPVEGPGVRAVGEILDYLFGGEAPVFGDIVSRASEVAEVGASPVSGSGAPEGGIIAFGNGNVLHHGDGRYSRRIDFPNLRAKLDIEAVELPKAMAESLGVAEGDAVEVESGFGKARLIVKIAAWLDDGRVLLPMHNPAVRALFDWGKRPALTPIGVKIKKL